MFCAAVLALRLPIPVVGAASENDAALFSRATLETLGRDMKWLLQPYYF